MYSEEINTLFYSLFVSHLFISQLITTCLACFCPFISFLFIFFLLLKLMLVSTSIFLPCACSYCTTKLCCMEEKIKRDQNGWYILNGFRFERCKMKQTFNFLVKLSLLLNFSLLCSALSSFFKTILSSPHLKSAFNNLKQRMLVPLISKPN